MRVLVINGPNINMLGIREPEIYGSDTYEDLVNLTLEKAKDLEDRTGQEVKVDFFQSNYEGALIDKIQEAYKKYDGIIMNPAGYTHTSIAILDALKAVGIPTVEVHISQMSEREAFRQHSYMRAAAVATITGEGIQGYPHALEILLGLDK